MANGYASRSGHQRLPTMGRKKATAIIAYAVCRDGMAATGLDWSACSAFNVLPALCRPIAAKPLDEMRATGSASAPFSAAHHGGAGGERKYVPSPARLSAIQRRMKR